MIRSDFVRPAGRPGLPGAGFCYRLRVNERRLHGLAPLAALATPLLAACNRGSPAPCTACLAVQGVYQEVSQTTQVACGGARVLYFNGGTSGAIVSQTGSRLSAEVLGTRLTGELHADGSAAFGPIPGVANSVDGSSPPTPGKLWLEGWFTVPAGTVTGFDGTYLFIADDDGCELDSQAKWTR